jgi:hypothetical protein
LRIELRINSSISEYPTFQINQSLKEIQIK